MGKKFQIYVEEIPEYVPIPVDHSPIWLFVGILVGVFLLIVSLEMRVMIFLRKKQKNIKTIKRN